MLGNVAVLPVINAGEFTLSNKSKNNANSIHGWLNDQDKISTDGNDDGKISLKETLVSLGKGVFGVFKTAIKSPIKTAMAISIGAAVSIATGGAILPLIITYGVVSSAIKIGQGLYKVSVAKLDGETKQAWETVGNGAFGIAASFLSSKNALTYASKGGVKGIENVKDLNTLQIMAKCFKIAPEALKSSIKNVKGNVLTWTTGTMHANSNILRNEQIPYMSKANEARAYKFNPNGGESDILKNNPGVFKSGDGNYCIPNKWNPETPHIINTSKDQMIMIYGPDDTAVCDGNIFKGSYVDTAAFKTNNLVYQDPKTLEFGKIVDVTKQAPGACKIAPVGTKVQTLEGSQAVQQGQAIAIDHMGNPYVTSISNILKRNIPLPGSKQSFEQLAKLSEA